MNILQKFDQIRRSPEYLGADSDLDRDNIRQNLFWEELAPRLNPDELETVKAKYDKMTAPEGDPTAGTLEDVGRSAGGGFLGVFGDMARFPTAGAPNTVSSAIEGFNEELLQGRSPTAIESERNTGLQFNPDTGGIELKPDSSLYGAAMQLSGAGGSMLSSLATGGVLGKGVGMAGKAMAGTKKAADAAIKASNFTKARQVLANSIKREQTAQRIGFGMTGSAMVGGGTSAQAYDQTLQETGSVALAEQAGQEAVGPGAALGAATMGLAGPLEQRLLMGRGGATRWGNALKGGGTETVQEFAESGGQEYLAGQAMRDIGLEVEDLEGRSLATGAWGAALGGVSGGALGGLSKPQKQYTQQEYDQAIEANNLEATRLEGELNTGNLTDEQRGEHEKKLTDIYRAVAIDEIAKSAARPAVEDDQAGESSAAQSQDADVADPGERRIPRQDWLPTNMSERYQNSIEERRGLVSQLRRAAQNGIADSGLKQYEDRIRAQDELINTNRIAVNNAGNQKYFANSQDFYAWLNRAARGANWEELALMELEARKGRPVDWPAMAQMEQNILQQGDIRDRARVLELNGIVQAVEERMAQSRINPQAGMEAAREIGEQKLEKRQKAAEQREQRRQEGAQRHQDTLDQQAKAKEGRAQERAHAEEQRRQVEQEQIEAERIRKQQKQKADREAAELQKHIDAEHWTDHKIGPYHVWAGKSDTFAVSGTTKPESSKMHALGGFFDKDSNSWEFPKNKRQAVKDALQEMAKKPQPKEKAKRKRVYPKTVRKRTRRARSQGREHGQGEFKALGGIEAALKPAFPNYSATHVWRNPETGKDELLIQSDKDWYTDQEGDDRFLTHRSGVKPVAAHQEEINRQKEEERKQQEEEAEHYRKKKAEQDVINEEEGKKYDEQKAQEDREREESEQRRKKHEEERIAFEEKQKQNQEKLDADIQELKRLHAAINSRAKELLDHPEFAPIKELVPWGNISGKVPDRAGMEKARSVPWARILEDAYRKTEGWNSRLFYADENVAVFKAPRDKLFVVKQTEAYKYLAWAEVSGKSAASPDLRTKQPKEALKENFGVAYHGDSYRGYGTQYDIINGQERDAWKGGWRGAVTRPVNKIKKAREKAEAKKEEKPKPQESDAQTSTKPENVSPSEKPAQKTPESKPTKKPMTMADWAESQVENSIVPIPFNLPTIKDGKSLILKNQKSDVVVVQHRPMVALEINGHIFPFYASTGYGGKQDVPTSKWYPFFGVGNDGWINKLKGKQMTAYYGSIELRALSEALDKKYPRPTESKKYPSASDAEEIYLDVINRDLNPTMNGLDDTFTSVVKNIKTADRRLQTATGRYKPEQKKTPKLIQDPKGLTHNELISAMEKGADARRKIKEVMPPADVDYLRDFVKTGQEPTLENIKAFQPDRLGYKEHRATEIQNNYHLGVDIENRAIAREEYKSRPTITPTPAPIKRLKEEPAEQAAVPVHEDKSIPELQRQGYELEGSYSTGDFEPALKSINRRANKDPDYDYVVVKGGYERFGQSYAVLKRHKDESQRPKPKYESGDRVKTRYSFGTVKKVGRKYAEVVDDFTGMVGKELIEKLSFLSQGDRAEELQLISDRFDDLIRKALENPSNWEASAGDLAKFIINKAKNLDSFPLRNSNQLRGLLQDEGIEVKGWLSKQIKAIKAEMNPPQVSSEDHYRKDFSNTEGDLSTLTLENLTAIAEKEKFGLKSIMQRIGEHPITNPKDALGKIRSHLERYKNFPVSIKQKLKEQLDQDEYATQLKTKDLTDNEKQWLTKNVSNWFNAGQHHYELKFIGSEAKRDRTLSDQQKQQKQQNAENAESVESPATTALNDLPGDYKTLQNEVYKALKAGKRIATNDDVVWVRNTDHGWVHKKQAVTGGFVHTKGGAGANTWSQEEAIRNITQDIEYDIREVADARPSAPETTVTPAETESASGASPAEQPTARQTRKRRRTGKLIEIDDELNQAADEFAEELRKGMGSVSSGVDPVLLAKFLQHGIKTSSLLIQKGAIKFADWADNMLAIMEDRGFDPEQIAPYLKRVYMATSVEDDIEHLADQMDDRKTVKNFDMDKLLNTETAYTAEELDADVVNAALDAGRNTSTGKRWAGSTQGEAKVTTGIMDYLFSHGPEDMTQSDIEDIGRELKDRLVVEEEVVRELVDSGATHNQEFKRKVLDNADDQNSRLAIQKLVKEAGLDFRRMYRDEGIESAKEKYAIWVKNIDKEAVVDRLMDYRKEYQTSESAKEAPPDQTEANTEAHPKTLTNALYQNLKSDAPITNNIQFKGFLGEHHGVLFREVTPEQLKKGQEAMEVALVMQARETVAEGKSDQETFNELVKQYQNQPLLNVRSSTSMKNQAYSTPAPLAYLAGHMAGITKDTTNYEPTAGNGMLLINGSVDKSSVNELEDLRVHHLEELGYQPTQKDATEYVPAGQHDAVITNPPFGTMRNEDKSIKTVRVQGYQIKKLEHLIAAKALEAMKDDGKASIIIGANRKEGEVGAMDKVFFNWLYKHYNVTDHFEVNGDLYKRQGAGWPVSVITVEGRKVDGNIIPGLREVSPKTGTLPRLNDWDSIYAHYRTVLDARRQRAENIGKAGTDHTQPQTATKLDVLPGSSGTRVGRTGGGTSGQSGSTKSSGSTGKPQRTADSGRGRQPTDERGGLPADDRSGVSAPEQDQVARNRKADAGGSRGHSGGDGGLAAGKLDGSPVEPAVTKSGYQVAYQTASQGFNEDVLTPVSMAEATNKALKRIAKEHGSVDAYVMDRLQYPDKTALHKAFMGLQVDTVAAAIYNAERQPRSKGIIIADQTGVGKGRQAAALIRYARLQGRIPIFMTEKPNLFTDMYDDLADIGEHEIKPFILNKDEFIKSKDGNKLFANNKSKHASLLKTLAEADVPTLPNGANALFMTYSQIDQDKLQRKLLGNLRAHNKIQWVLDESHSAAGEREKKVKGGTRITRAGFVSEMIDQGNVLYLSATYAKRPDNMPLYYRTDLMDAVDKEDDLIDALANGGVPLQTVMANMLAESGQLFRRERSFEGIKVETVVDYDNSAKHKKQYDEVIKGLQAVTHADTVFDNNYFKHHKALAEESGGGAIKAGNKASSSLNHTNFTSIIHNYVRQLLMAMKVDNVVENAIATHQRGEKIVIALENTMGSFMEETASQAGLKVGDVYESNYRDILLRALARTRRISNKEATGDQAVQQIELHQLDEITKEAYKDAEKIINNLDVGELPASPIDYIRYRLEAAGISTGEITGRKLTIDYTGDTPVLSNRSTEEMNDRRGTVNKFNDGRIDAMILNAAGSTGLSIHASEKFTDQRPRKMLVMQASLNINTMMQMLGRINRTGQLKLPSYELLALDLPAEKRPQSVLSRKMASLNANTSANSHSDTSIDAPDILNKYGSRVIATFMNENPDIARAINMQNDMVAEDREPPSDLANKFTGRMALLTVKQQEQVYAEIETAYTDLIKYMDSTGQNELNPQTLDLDAVIEKSKIIYEGKAPGTVFGGNTTLHKVDAKYQGTPPTPQDVEKSLNKALKDATPDEIAKKILADKKADDYQANLDKIFEATQKDWIKLRDESGLTGDLDPILDYLTNHEDYGEYHKLTKRFRNYRDRIESTEQAKQAYKESKGKTEGGIEEYKIGNHYKLDLGDELVTAVVTGIKNTHKAGQGNSYALSKTKVTFAVNSGIRQVEIPFSKLLTQGEGAVVQDRLRSKGTQRLDDLFKIGGLLGNGERREYRYIATGNLISGLAKLAGGRIVDFTDKTGKSHKGILMPKKFGAEQFQAAAGNYLIIRDADVATRMLRQNGDELGKLGLAFPGLKGRVYKSSPGYFEISLPKSNKDPVSTKVKFSEPLLAAMGSDFYGAGATMTARFPDSHLDRAMKELIKLTTLQVPRSQGNIFTQAGGKIPKSTGKGFDETIGRPGVQRRSKGTPSGISVQLAKDIAELFMKKFNIDDKTVELIVAKNAEELYEPGHEEFLGAVVSEQSDIPRVVILADNHSTQEEVGDTLAHEIIGHLGLAKFLTPEHRRELLKKVINSKRLLQPAWKEIQTRYGDKPIYQQAEEVVAHLAENPQWDNSRWRKIVHFIVEKLQSVGLFKDYVTRPQIESILGDIAEHYSRGTPGNTKFSVGYGKDYQEFGPGTGKNRNRLQDPSAYRLSQSGQETRGETEQDSIKKVVSDLVKLDKDAVSRLAANTQGTWRRVKGSMLGALGGRQIADIYGPLFKKFTDAGVLSTNPITTISNLMQGMQALRNDWVHKAEKIDQRWARLARQDKRRYQDTAKLMYESTLTGIDPRLPFKPEKKRTEHTRAKYIEDYQRVEALWSSLSPTAQQLYTDVEQHYKNQYKATQKAMIERAKGLFEPREAHEAIQKLKQQFGTLKGPYFPLMRHGDYYVKGIDAEGKEYREHFEKEGEYLAAKKQLQDQGMTITEDGKIAPYEGSDTSGVMPFVVKMEKRLLKDTDSQFSRREKMKFLDELHQASLAMLPDTSAAKRSMHRRQIAGYDSNARRAFNSTALTGSNRLARVTYGWQVEEALKKMREATKNNAKTRALTDQQNIVAQDVITELKKRHDLNMNPNTHAASAFATNFAFLTYLGGSLGAGLINLTQTPLLALPVLGGRYGYRRTSRYMAKASADYFGKGKRKFADTTDFMTNAWFTLEGNQKLSDDERALIQTLIDDGTIETTQASSMAGNAGVDLDQPRAVNRDWYNNLVRGSGIWFHNAEVANRQITALAAYRLWRDAQLKNKPSGHILTSADIAKGAAFARKATFDSHFDYSNYNRPRYMKGNWARVFLIFKQYSQNMAYLLGRTFYNATKNKALSKEERTVARRQMAGILGLSTMASGLMGLPGIALLTWFAEAVGGDEDDPYDAEVEFRKYLAGLFGKDVAHALSKGVANGFLGIDLHSRVKLSDMFYQSDNRDLSPRDEALGTMATVSGPFFSYLINSWVGLNEVMEGDGWRGMERMMPKFIRDGMRTIRYNDEGLVDASGNVMVEDFSLYEKAWRTIGIGSAKESEAWEARSAVKGYQSHIGRRRSTLLNDYDKARRENDQDALQRVMEQIGGFNAARRINDQPKLMISGKTLSQSSRTRERRRKQTEKGIYLPSSQLGMRDLTTGYVY